MPREGVDVQFRKYRRTTGDGYDTVIPRLYVDSGCTQRWLAEAAQLTAQHKCSGASPDSALACCLTFGKFLQAFLCLSFPNYKMGEIEERSNV